MAVVRLGLVGAGGVARLHAEAARALPGEVRVTAVCDVDTGRARELAELTGATVHPGHAAMLPHVDALIVGTPHGLHLAPALDAAAAGVHVLMEKPMATSLADCDAMAAACAEVVLFVGHIQHYLPITRTARDVLASGRLGRPVAMVDRRATDYRPGHRPAWFFDPELAGGGAVMNIGAHSIDRLTWLTGSRAVRVSARLERRGAAVETEGLLQLELESGVLATVSITSGVLPQVDEVEVLCERGTLRASRADGVWVATGGAAERVLAPGDLGIAGAFRDQLADFAAAVRGERAAAIGPEVGRAVVATVLAAYGSAASGRPEPVDHPRPQLSGQVTGQESGQVTAGRASLGQP